MIKKLTVESFKSLEKVEVDLGAVNVFIGGNGSGKSNLLEAVGVLSAAANGRVDDEALLRRGVRPGVPKLYKSAFPGSKAPHIFFAAQNSDSLYEVALFNPVQDPKPAWRYHTELWQHGDKKIIGRSHRMRQKGNPEAGLAALVAVNRKPGDPALALLESLRNYAIYSPNTAVLRGIVQDFQLREPVGLSGGGLPNAIGALFLRNLGSKNKAHPLDEIMGMIDWARGIGFAPSAHMPLSPSAAASKWVVRFRDRYMAEKRNVLSGYDASEGALYVLFVAVLAIHEQSPEFFALDNADHGLNPRLARRMMECLCNWILNAPKPRQVMLTTHNPLVLDGLPIQDDRVRLFTVDRNNTGRTIVTRLQLNDKLIAKAKEGWTLSRLWVMGHLGGVPNV